MYKSFSSSRESWGIMSCETHRNQPSCVLRVPIFKNLDMDTIEKLHEIIQKKTYKKGDFIFREGDRSETLFVVSDGMIKISKISEKGKEHSIRFLFPGDFFGQFALLQDKTHYANAEALEDVVVCTIHKNDFKEMLAKNPQITYQFLVELTNRLRETDEWVSNISLLEVERRLAKLLLIFYERSYPSNQILELPVAKKELAALIGTTPETVSRKLSHFESLGFIQLIGRTKIRMIDPNRLEKLV
ncbi:Crp/Fnr family transcriptional regulator [Fodinisporobacter ferrooxydans]|uniref:Crp/Fnr family transcriptional regulator n=1 Tax=Fodinisporobacter ferrooxydans TaxID=2901836 RepID=A0ABY4CK41_9BACL|nr:Crp/Fnr family transcriptional regulator [Alicyclobacillaceae bacterium MYW30-H2]